MPDVRGTPSSASSFVLEIDIQGHVDRRPLSYGTSTLGRDSGDIIIPHQIVSSTHLSIDVKDSGVVITDLESTNGTFVDGRRLAPHAPTPVTSAQQVMLGGTVRLAFVPAQGGGATPARKKQATQIVD
jgi:pSer/pThr/pTyr-binding forkhead associated (FHA) protein